MSISTKTTAGLGASHQTGWKGTVAPVLDLFARASASEWLRTSKSELAAERDSGIGGWVEMPVSGHGARIHMIAHVRLEDKGQSDVKQNHKVLSLKTQYPDC